MPTASLSGWREKCPTDNDGKMCPLQDCGEITKLTSVSRLVVKQIAEFSASALLNSGQVEIIIKHEYTEIIVIRL